MEIKFKNKTLPLLIFLFTILMLFGAFLALGETGEGITEFTDVTIRISGAIIIILSCYVLSNLQVSLVVEKNRLIFEKYIFFRKKTSVIEKSEIEKIETPYSFYKKGILIISLKNSKKVEINFNYMHSLEKNLEVVKVRQYIFPAPAFLGAVEAAKIISSKYQMPYTSIFIRNDN